MIRTWSRVYAKAVLPFMRNEANPSEFTPLTATIPALDDGLVSAYADWSGASGRYPDHIPAHMFCQWGLPLAIQVIEQTRYDITTIINQGLSMRVHGELPRGVPLLVRAEMVSVEEQGGRANLVTRVVTGTEARPRLVETLLHSTFILASGRARNSLNRAPRLAGANWLSAGQWRADPDDGLNFAVLTGDFNPIHWVESAGKKSPFGTTVLQGMGAFARSFETLRADQPIREIEVQFQRPVLLPSGALDVQRARSEGSDWQALRLVDGEGRVRLSGRFRP
jgi:acyl dehydratase